MMTSGEITHFLSLLGVKGVVVDAQRGWVRSSCPLAPWTHASGEDRHPSFGIKVPSTYADVPYFTCFACGRSGPLSALVSALIHFTGRRMAEACDFLSQYELFKDNGDTADIPKRKRLRLTDRFADVSLAPRIVSKNVPVPKEVLDQFPPLWEKSDLNAHADALRWLTEERKIAFQPVGKFKLRLYTNALDDVGVIFPILDADGETVLDMWVRLIDRKRFFRLTAEMAGTKVEYRAPNLLFGNHLQTDGETPCLLVEGPLDALRLASLGVQRPMATFGALSSEQIDSFYSGVVYLGFDNDEAGRTFTKKALRELKACALSVLDWGVVGKKDAGELESKEEFIQVFNARKKVLRASKVDSRIIEKEEDRPQRHFLSSEGTIL